MSERQLDEYLHPVQVEILRKMSPEERLRLSGELSRATWNRPEPGSERGSGAQEVRRHELRARTGRASLSGHRTDPKNLE